MDGYFAYFLSVGKSQNFEYNKEDIAMFTKCLTFPVLGVLLALGIAPFASAQVHGGSGQPTAPRYGSRTGTFPMADGAFNTPETDGRPGVKFFTYAMRSYQRGDYDNAVYMLKLSAFWAYEPADYNLGVMYYNGKGVAEDRPLGAAWMVFAAERGNAHYVKLRDMMLSLLSKTQVAQAAKYLDELRPKYGNKVTTRRAKWQWKLARNSETGSRLGATTGPLSVGVYDAGHTPPAGKKIKTAMGLLRSGSISGVIAYQQFLESNDPYSPTFLKNRKGKVKVEPLKPARGTPEKPSSDTKKSPRSPHP